MNPPLDFWPNWDIIKERPRVEVEAIHDRGHFTVVISAAYFHIEDHGSFRKSPWRVENSSTLSGSDGKTGRHYASVT